MSTNEREAAATDPVSDHDEADPTPARRRLVAALLSVAGVGAIAQIGKLAATPEIKPDDAERRREAPGSSGSNVSWVTTIGTQPDLTNINLRAMTGTTGEVVVALGFEQEGDGGGGVFAWNPGTSADDGGTIIVPAGVSSGFWQRIYSGPIDVRWFGCALGATDDSARLASAINALPASGGQILVTGKVRIAPAAFGGFHVTGKNDIAFVGRDTGCGFVLPVPSSTYYGLHFLGCARVELRNLLIDGLDQPLALLYLEGVTESIVADCVIKNAVYDGIVSKGGGRNIYRGNRISSCGIGIEVGYASAELEPLIADNVLTGCATAGVVCCALGASISGNTILGCGDGVQVRSGAAGVSQGITISGNVIRGGHGLAVRHEVTASIGAKSWIVSENIIDGNGPSAGDPPGTTGGWIKIQYVDQIIVSKNQIRNNGTNLSLAGIHLFACNDVTISDNLITDDRAPAVQGPGIYVGDRTLGVIIANNVIENPGPGIPDDPNGEGIHLAAGRPATWGGLISDVVVTGNVLRGCTGFGLRDLGVRNLAVSNNQFINCGFGAWLGGQSATVIGNVFRGNNFGYAHAAKDAYLSSNVYSENAHDISALWGAPPSGAMDLVHSTGESFNPDPPNLWIDPSLRVVSGEGTHKKSFATATTLPAASSLWKDGDILYNTAPAVSGNLGWVYVSAQTSPWRPFGTIT